jgi:lysyl-tRNA synthetase class 2
VEAESSDLVAARRRKLEELRERGIDPFPNDFRPADTAAGVEQRFGALSREQLEGVTDTVSVAGRIVAMRDFGKASFLHLQDRTGRIQAYVKRDVVGDDAFAVFKAMDMGDFAGITGRPFRTRTNELTIEAKSLRLLGSATST